MPCLAPDFTSCRPQLPVQAPLGSASARRSRRRLIGPAAALRMLATSAPASGLRGRRTGSALHGAAATLPAAAALLQSETRSGMGGQRGTAAGAAKQARRQRRLEM